MKYFKCMLLTFVMIFSTVLYGGCDSDEYLLEGYSSFYGRVVVNPSIVKMNEFVTFSIGDFTISADDVFVSINSSTMIDGKDVIKSISYYVDGKKVAEGSDKENGYSASWQVTNVSVGSHVVSAKCTSNFKGYTIGENIIQETLVVE